MLHFFLNPWMLLGLAGVLLPVLAHLLSRKKYDIVEWGAMQFLELDPSARRRLRLEELLLLAVRMGLVALLAIALARPWLSGAWLGRWGSTQSRDVVLVIDGSYSMGWEGRAVTPHANAVRLARQFVDQLRPGDSMMVLDAREQPRPDLPGPTRDKQRVREALENLPTPRLANLHEAIAKAVQLLASGTNLQREVIVFTDQQALSWKPDDEALWARLDDLKEQSSLPPRVWVLDVAEGQLGKTGNFAIERLQLSRELAVPGVPVRISSKVRYAGGDGAISRKVYLEVNGQRLADQTLQVKLQPEGEATVEFDPDQRALADQAFPCVFDALATGCALALVMPHLARSERVARLLAARWFLPVAALGLLLTPVSNPFIQYGVAMTCANLAIAAIVLRCVAKPESRVSRVLERPAIVWLGTMSYSIYLWQQLFLNRHSSLWMHQFPANVGFALLAAVACHYLIEQPFLRISAARRAAAEARAGQGLEILGPPNEVLDVSEARASQVTRVRETGGMTPTWSSDRQRGQ